MLIVLCLYLLFGNKINFTAITIERIRTDALLVERILALHYVLKYATIKCNDTLGV